MMRFNQNDDYDRKKQLEYLNNKPEYQEDKLRINIDLAKKHNIIFLYQNKFSDGKIWEWNISKMVQENKMPKPIVKEMNHYTYVNEQHKVPKKVYMLTLDMGYEI